MKKLFFIHLFILAVLSSTFAKQEYASVYFYVPKKISILPATIHISINGVAAGELKKGELLEYRVNSPQTILIEIQGRGKGIMSNPIFLDLEVKDIEEHYYEAKWLLNGIKLEKVKLIPERLKSKNPNVLNDEMLAEIQNDTTRLSSTLTSSGFKWMATGTGFFINEKGYIATNYHVVEGASACKVEVPSESKSYRAVIVSIDKQNDLAILKIEDDSFKSLRRLRYNFTTSLNDVGTDVFTLGYPLIEIMGSEIKYTDGVISSRTGYQGDVTTYQITVPIQPGNSGGPLFTSNGNLVGITSSGMDIQLVDNVNYAIKTVYLKTLIDSTNDKIKLPNYTKIRKSSKTQKIKTLSNYVVLIKIR